MMRFGLGEEGGETTREVEVRRKGYGGGGEAMRVVKMKPNPSLAKPVF